MGRLLGAVLALGVVLDGGMLGLTPRFVDRLECAPFEDGNLQSVHLSARGPGRSCKLGLCKLQFLPGPLRGDAFKGWMHSSLGPHPCGLMKLELTGFTTLGFSESRLWVSRGCKAAPGAPRHHGACSSWWGPEGLSCKAFWLRAFNTSAFFAPCNFLLSWA